MSYELYHHGVKGQKWGVRKGPPYPLVRVNSKVSAREENDIYRSLTTDEKRKVMGLDKGDKNVPTKFTTDDELKSKKHIKSFVARYGDVPVSAFDVWNDGDGNVALSIMTRGGSEYRGKGYATTTVKRGMKWVDNNPQILTAYWDVRKDNAPSIALAKKHGFKLQPENPKYKNWIVYQKHYAKETP